MLDQLMREIGMPRDAAEQVLAAELPAGAEEAAAALRGERSGWDAALDGLRVCLGEDPRGISMLRAHLLCAMDTREAYRARGISDRVFRDTMGCFPRFVAEYRAMEGVPGFDRAFWTPRQLSMRLFRLGELEYELLDGGEVGLHIPSDASLERAGLRASWEEAQAFFRRFEPAYAGAPVRCESWLLSPVLREILPADSRILAFQAWFRTERVFPEDDACLRWVFGLSEDRRVDPAQLPGRTSLQRGLRAYLMRGGHGGAALGTLDKEPFIDKGGAYGAASDSLA